jgi:hypothetical protein
VTEIGAGRTGPFVFWGQPRLPDHFDINRRNWDDCAAIHVRDEAGSYRVQAFLDGADNLHDIEHG